MVARHQARAIQIKDAGLFKELADRVIAIEDSRGLPLPRCR
jgi:hypothetical protein